MVDGYDVRNFNVHTGLAGVMGFNREMFELVSSKALRNIADCMVSAITIVGAELRTASHVEGYDPSSPISKKRSRSPSPTRP